MTEQKQQSVLLSVLDNYGGYPFDELFDVVYPTYGTREVEFAKTLANPVVMVLWGGQDISPSIYGQTRNVLSDSGDKPSPRDEIEVAIARCAIELEIPIIGICRGAQLMCALSGATVIQHVDNHAGGYHLIDTHDDRAFNCPSLHHQMMYPWPRIDLNAQSVEFELIAWSKGRSRRYLAEPIEDIEESMQLKPPVEPEIVWFPKTKSLCIQSHPEFIPNKDNAFVKYCLELATKYVLKA